MRKKKEWIVPQDLDPECRALCVALNRLPGIETTCSCCGHGKHPFWIFFHPKNLKVLPDLLYYLDKCHSGCAGWRAIVYTDCAGETPFFMIEGPIGKKAYDDANHIAKLLEEHRECQN